MKKNLIITIIIVLAVGGGAFYGGMKYAGSKSPSANLAQGARQFNQRAGVGTGTGARNGGAGFVSGDVIKKDATSITVKMPDGSTKIIFVPDTAKVQMSVDGKLTDVAIGKTVIVNGNTNSDGSVTASNIQIRNSADIGNFRGGGGNPGQQSSTTPRQPGQ
jgi:hypothetical protein